MRPSAWLVLAGLLAAAAPAGADVAALLGRRVTDVRLVEAAAPVLDRAVLALIETPLGEPLRMADVRQTIDHFVTLGRYADIRVFAEADGADGVRLRYEAVPLERVVVWRFTGVPGGDCNACPTSTTTPPSTNTSASASPLARTTRPPRTNRSPLMTLLPRVRAPLLPAPFAASITPASEWRQ